MGPDPNTLSKAAPATKRRKKCGAGVVLESSQSLILEASQDADDVEVCVCARVRVCVCKGERGRERERERERVHTQSTLVACPL